MRHLKESIMVMGVLFALVYSTGPVLASPPALVNFQGHLNDSTGSPVADGTYQIKFTIYDAPSSGTALWNSGSQAVTTTGGLFTYVLGQDVAFPDGLFSGGPNRWLGITVGTDPEMTPREQLVSSPYALHAQTADTVYWTGIKSVPVGFADGVDNDGGGDITDVTAGVGLSGGGTTGSVAVSADETYLQRRVTGFASAGSAITGINADGTVTTSSFGNITGNIDLAQSTVGDGNILKSGTRFIHNYGSHNTFAGYGAGNFTMAGANCTGVGEYALGGNSSGNSNTAFGTHALLNNSSGTFNTSVGTYSLSANTAGFWNTAVGYAALQISTTGNSNTAIGNEALSDNSGGNGNTAVGSLALKVNQSGSLNVAVGSATLDSNVNGASNTAVGTGSLGANVSGNYNTAVGLNALVGNVSGNLNTAIGYSANISSPGFSNSVAIGANASVNASNKIRLGNSSVTVIEGQVAYTFTSDKNQKENFRPVDGNDVLAKIRNMSLTSWNYRGQDPAHFRHYGPVAQEFYEAFGHDEVGSSGTETTINSGDQAGILMIAVQKLANDNELIKAENKELKAALTALRSEIDALRQSVAAK